LGRSQAKDIRNAAVTSLARRYHVDRVQARRVARTALYCSKQLLKEWGLNPVETRNWLVWGAWLHEIGLDIAHSQYHKHGAYIAEFSDLAGFSRQEQLVLAALIVNHRRKFNKSYFNRLAENRLQAVRYWTIILRLAVLLHRSRSPERLPRLKLKTAADGLQLSFPKQWLESHQLTNADLEQEAEYLSAIDFKLGFS
jgi:exopolyphosphatase/guanosine-5'-triphosphate,3'-diphosphate pyrophosphatase